MQFFLCSRHADIEHSSFFFDLRIQNRFLIWHTALVNIQNIHPLKFQSFGTVQGRYNDSLLPAHFLRLFFEFFFVRIHGIKPFLKCFIPFCALLDLPQKIIQFFHFDLPVLCIFFQELVIADPIPDIIDSCKRCHIFHHFQIMLELLDPVTHPFFSLVKLIQNLKWHFFLIKCFPGQISVRTVHDGKKILSLPTAHCQTHISNHIFCQPVFIQIRQDILHGKRNVVLHQPFHCHSAIMIGTE